MSRSQNKPYLFHHEQNMRYWTEEDLPAGWCFEWKEGAKLYRNVLTDITQKERPNSASSTTSASTTSGPTKSSNPEPPVAVPTITTTTTTTASATTTTAAPPAPPAATDDETYEQEEEAYDSRVGYPETKPAVVPYSHGWCFKPQKFGLQQVLDENTMCVVELGSYLGNSAKNIVEFAPNAQIYCVDRWDFDFIKKYQSDQYQEYELEIMKGHPLYETFLINTWDLQEREVDAEGNCAGIVPMRMDTVDALNYLHENGAYPDVIYIDGDHSTPGVRRDLEAALLHFPEAIILGNDYRNPTVQVAIDTLAGAQKPAPLQVYTDSYSMLWTFSQLDEGNYNNVKCVEDAENETISKCYFKLQKMISKNCTKQELAHELVHTDRKKFVPYLNHCAKKNKGRTLLMHAAFEGHTSVIELLSDIRGLFCVDVNIQGHNNEYTALHYAAYGGHAASARALLRAGAKCTLVNKYDETAGQSAHSRGHADIENGLKRWLEQHPETKKKSGSSALKEHTKQGHGMTKSSGGGASAAVAAKASGGDSNGSSRKRPPSMEVEVKVEVEAAENDDEKEEAEPSKKRARKE